MRRRLEKRKGGGEEEGGGGEDEGRGDTPLGNMHGGYISLPALFPLSPPPLDWCCTCC